MLIEWMAYAALFASIVHLGALAAERAVAVWTAGQRFIWIASVLIAAAVPVVLATRVAAAVAAPTESAPPQRALTVDANAQVVRLRPAALSADVSLRTRAARTLASIDPYMRGMWVLASVACLALFGRAAVVARRQRSRWRPLDLDGSRVLIAPNVGPAVIGALRPAVVIPEWALALDGPARALMLRHEREHIRARDPLMLAVAGIAVAVFPWNPALWMLARRLRLAIEIDCDRRVLKASSQQHEYGLLLLAVGARKSTSLPFVTSLAERRPFLERRILAMTSARPRNPRIVSLACVALTLAATTAAARAPRPQPLSIHQAPTPAVVPITTSAVTAPTPAGAPTPAVTPMVASAATRQTVEVAPVVATKTPTAALPATANGIVASPAVAPTPVIAPRVSGEPIPIEVIRALISAHYPSVFKGDPTINQLTFVFDANGNMVITTSAYQPRDVVMTTRAYQPLDTASDDVNTKEAQIALDLKRLAEIKAVSTRAAADAADSIRINYVSGARSDSDAVLAARRKAKMELAATTSDMRKDHANALVDGLVDPARIESVEVRKFRAGDLAPLALGIVIVQLKK